MFIATLFAIAKLWKQPKCSPTDEQAKEMQWQPTPVFLFGESRGQRSLAGYSPWGHRSQTRIHN